jgi:UDP-N-acetylglucosamine--N-acetylmuramyl-(pentapeptide) pyrophosphoryl-undecaprenol N-acetylglucosamine transferase
MKVMIAAGGTGGHINPGLAIARGIQAVHPKAVIRFVGTKKGLEANLIPREGFGLSFIDVRGFRRRLSWDTAKTFGIMIRSFFQAGRLLREWSPDLVVGTGGYVCGPMLSVAALMGIPTLLHESNALPGITSKLLAPFVSRVAVNFEDAAGRLSRHARIRVTGNPVRQSLMTVDKDAARAKFGLAKNDLFVVAFFGSLGSETLNRMLIDMLIAHPDGLGYRMLFGTGLKHHEKVMAALGGHVPPGVEIQPYLYEVDDVLAAADLAVCRAGAMTPGELCILGVPSILIPSPYVADNHQEYNARSLESRGASVVVLEKFLSGALLHEQILTLLNDHDLRRRMAAAALKLARREAGTDIQEMVDDLLRLGRGGLFR